MRARGKWKKFPRFIHSHMYQALNCPSLQTEPTSAIVSQINDCIWIIRNIFHFLFPFLAVRVIVGMIDTTEVVFTNEGYRLGMRVCIGKINKNTTVARSPPNEWIHLSVYCLDIFLQQIVCS